MENLFKLLSRSAFEPEGDPGSGKEPFLAHRNILGRRFEDEVHSMRTKRKSVGDFRCEEYALSAVAFRHGRGLSLVLLSTRCKDTGRPPRDQGPSASATPSAPAQAAAWASRRAFSAKGS